MRSLLLTLSAVVATVGSARAQLALPQVLGPHMVLQRETQVPLFGKARPRAQVEVVASWPGAERVRVTADANGQFRADLKTGAAGGPFTLTIASGNEAIRLDDVLLGEVWLCSGQSNMEWPLHQALDGEVAIAAADRPDIRLFQVENRTAPAPQDDVGGAWKRATPASVRDFSAVAWFFAAAVTSEIGVPVGLIQSDWGGTPAEAWTRADALAAFAEFKPGLDRLRTMDSDPAARASKQARAEAQWQDRVRALDLGRAGPGRPLSFAAVGLDDSEWETLPVPGRWTGTPFGDFDGVAWYRRTVDIDPTWSGRDLVVDLGTIDDDDTAFFDGIEIGATSGWNVARRYRVPGRLVRGGRTTLAVRVHDTGGEGGFGPAAGAFRLRLADDTDGANAVSLAGPWRVARSVDQSALPPRPALDRVGPGEPSSLWNAMIAPLVPFAFRGALWYQGESNVQRFAQYREMFPAMISDWRRQFGRGDFPFLLVQLAPFAYDADVGQAALLRDAQRRTLDLLPNVGMAVTLDVGDRRDIHPRDKATVGRRLALWALATCYGKDIEFSGPLFTGAQPEGHRLRVLFTHAKGLRTRSGSAPTCFRVAGADGVWHDATARIDGESVVLEADGVAEPIDACYAFGAADAPELENAAGLPAASFVSRL